MRLVPGCCRPCVKDNHTGTILQCFNELNSRHITSFLKRKNRSLYDVGLKYSLSAAAQQSLLLQVHSTGSTAPDISRECIYFCFGKGYP